MSRWKKVDKKQLYILSGIVLIGIVLRIIGLNTGADMGLREHYYYLPSVLSDNVKEVIFHDISINLFHQPLYNFMLFLLSRFSTNETFLRLLSLFWGTLTIIALFKLTQSMFGPKIALISSFLISINPMHIYWSGEISPYALYCFFAVLSFYFFYRAFIQNIPNAAIWYCGSIILGFFSHYFMIFVIFAQLLSLIIISIRQMHSKNAKNLLRYLLTLCIFSYFVIIWFPFLHYSLNSHIHSTIYSQHKAYSLQTAQSFWVLLRIIPSFSGIIVHSAYVSIIAIVFFIIGLWAINKNDKLEYILLAIAIFTVLFFHAFCHIVGSRGMKLALTGVYIMWDHIIYILPLIIVVWAYFFGHLFKKKTVTGIFCLMTIAAIYSDYNLIANQQKPNLSKATRFVKCNIADKDAVFFPNIWFVYGFNYYMHRDTEDLSNMFFANWRIIARPQAKLENQIRYYGPIWPEPDSPGNVYSDEVKQTLAEGKIKRIWFVDIREQFFGIPLVGYQNSDMLLKRFLERYQLILSQDFEYIKLYLFNLKGQENPDKNI
ncbi:glycosyltransferase family 39 protein [Patescibacteria group bacterium]|nr:glycosyltransferase family 39 protein [Patescibacteria group bacterium]